MLYTFKELESKRGKAKKPKPQDSVKKIKVEDKPSIIYTLAYPDNESHHYFTGEYKIDIKGKIKTLEIISGSIRTDQKEVSEVLITKGFVLLGMRPIEIVERRN